MRRERDRLPFTAEARRHLHRMAEMMRGGQLEETRRYEQGFLHAKVMLLDGVRERADRGLVEPDASGPDAEPGGQSGALGR